MIGGGGGRGVAGLSTATSASAAAAATTEGPRAAGVSGSRSVGDPFWSLHPQDGAQFFAYAYGINMVLNKLMAIAVVALEQRKVPLQQ